VFVVTDGHTPGKFVKFNPGCALDECGHDVIFQPLTPIKLIGRAKISVIDFSS